MYYGELENRECLNLPEYPHPYHYSLALVVNKSPAVYIYYHPRSTDFEEELEGL